MNRSWLIQHGRIIDPANGCDQVADLLVIAGRIAAMEGPVSADIPRIDASGCWVTPGLIDMHTHLREPGAEYKEDIRSGARAAAAGGFTGIACMANTSPVNDCPAVTSFILSRAHKAAVRVYPIAALSQGMRGECLAEFGDLKEAGAVAISDDGKSVVNSQLMRRALEYASDFGLKVIAHCEDPFLSNGCMHEGAVATRLGLKGIPVAAESVMAHRDIALAECTGKAVHIAHVSCAQTVELIRQAKQRGVRVSAETAPHYFTLTDEAVLGFNTQAKMNPPLRSAADRDAIIAGLADGALDAIATDHAPHSILEKELEFDQAANGVIGLETALPLSLALVRQGHISPMRLVRLFTQHPARILGLDAGALRVGAQADITLIDPNLSFVYTKQEIVSKSANTPFLDYPLQGRAVLTMLGGVIQHQLGFAHLSPA